MTQPDHPPIPLHSPLVSTDLADLITPGVVVEVSPAEAEAMGAFEEDALDAEAAWDANADVEAA